MSNSIEGPVGVFCFSEIRWSAEIEDRIHLFASEDDAYQWMAERLMDGMEIELDGMTEQWVFSGETFGTDRQVVEAWQDSLEPLEFFHVYPAVSHS